MKEAAEAWRGSNSKERRRISELTKKRRRESGHFC